MIMNVWQQHGAVGARERRTEITSNSTAAAAAAATHHWTSQQFSDTHDHLSLTSALLSDKKKKEKISPGKNNHLQSRLLLYSPWALHTYIRHMVVNNNFWFYSKFKFNPPPKSKIVHHKIILIIFYSRFWILISLKKNEKVYFFSQRPTDNHFAVLYATPLKLSFLLVV